MKKNLLQNLQEILRDFAKAFLMGAVAGLAAALLFFLIGLALGGLQNGLEAAKDGLLAIGALGLFVLAGMLLVKGKKPEQFDLNDGWRKHFKIIGMKSVMGMICVVILLIAAVADYVLLILQR